MDIQKELNAMMDITLKPQFELAINEVIEKSYKADIEKLGSGMAILVKSQWEQMKPYLFFAYCLGAKAQAVPEGFGDIQSWIAVNSFSALDASIVNFPVVDANELAEFIDSLNIDVAVPEGFVLVKKDHLSEAVEKIELMFEEDSTLALGELLPIQQGIKAMIEAQEPAND